MGEASAVNTNKDVKMRNALNCFVQVKAFKPEQLEIRIWQGFGQHQGGFVSALSCIAIITLGCELKLAVLRPVHKTYSETASFCSFA